MNDKIKLKGRVRFILQDINTGEKEITEWKDNLITTAGKQAILNRLGNLQAKINEGMITYGAVGQGAASPAITDTTLASELDRAPISFVSLSGLILTIRVFFSTSQAIGSITEFGWFGEDASIAPTSGTLFNHILFNKDKDSSKTLTVEQEIEMI